MIGSGSPPIDAPGARERIAELAQEIDQALRLRALGRARVAGMRVPDGWDAAGLVRLTIDGSSIRTLDCSECRALRRAIESMTVSRPHHEGVALCRLSMLLGAEMRSAGCQDGGWLSICGDCS